MPTPTGTAYTIAGSADCAHFARCERVANMLKAYLNLPESDIQIETKHPIEWSEFLEGVRNRKGLAGYRPNDSERVIVWCPLTNRLVGGAGEFRAEVKAKYGLECDLTWGTLKQCAKENMQLLNMMRSHRQERAEQRSQRTLTLAVCGAAGAGKATQCNKLKEKYGVEVVSVSKVVQEHVEVRTELGKEAQQFVNLEEEVPDALLISMLAAKLSSPEVVASGYALQGFPATAAQAWALYAAGFDPLVLVLEAPDEVLEARQASPPQAAQETLKTRRRAYYQHIDALMKVYEANMQPAHSLISVAASAGAEEVFERIVTICGEALDRE